jgi:hypothetical protein
MKHLLYILPLLAALLGSCGEVTDEYSRYPCYLVIDNLMHNDATLASAMTANTGVFVTVTITTQSGAKYFVFKSNQGTETKTVFYAIDQRRQFILGQNGALIVGYGFSIDGIFYAYDRECPNCFDPNAIPMRSHPLTVSDNGFATCATCHRQYNLNNRGIIAQGDPGKRMTRYHASTTGWNGVLSVH